MAGDWVTILCMSKYSAKQDAILRAGQKILARSFDLAEQNSATNQQFTPEQIHQLRVNTKKLRALVQLYRPYCGKNAIKSVEQKIKRVADAFSGARDAHVMYATLCALVEVYSAEELHNVQPLLQYYAGKHQNIHSAPPALDLHKALHTIAETWQKKIRPKRQPDFEQGLEHSYQKARKLAFDAESLDEDELYHQCRKWVKYYLYQVQLSPYKKTPIVKPYVTEIKALAELLGQFHDRCELERALNKLLNKKTSHIQELESAATLMLSWLVEQKRADKERCQHYFQQLFSQTHNPVSH